mmetsp:Transcript_83612/g.235944  ORF Transcript_83612/g.235944 Transcript_83612/m.235944 type:complete len:125 (+) Transcript_83612:440-814(+)
MAATRPLVAEIYTALRSLGAPANMEPIGYRMPFAMIGVKGLPEGEAVMAMDKTKVIVRLEARVTAAAADAGGATAAVSLSDKTVERYDITDHILATQEETADGDGKDGSSSGSGQSNGPAAMEE